MVLILDTDYSVEKETSWVKTSTIRTMHTLNITRLPFTFPQMKKIFLLSLLAPLLLPLTAIVPACSAAEAKQNSDASAKSPSAMPAKGYKDLNVEEFDKLRSNTNAVLLDVRTPEEFASGHIPGAKNIDINSLDFEKKVGELDKSKTYLVNCASGGRSARACGKLSKLDFPKCYNLAGGIHAWEKAGKPVEK